MIAVILPPVAHIRRHPEAVSELVSQAPMGTPVQVLEERNGYHRCSTPEGYQGWISADDLGPPPPEYADPQRMVAWRRLVSLHPAPDSRTAPVATISLGTRLPLLESRPNWRRVRLPDGHSAWFQSERAREAGDCWASAEGLLELARELLGTPYLWGGSSSFGVDCSGFVQLLYGAYGCLLPRDAHQQATVGRPVADGSLEPGDLLFFADSAKGEVNHVGLCAGEGRLYHASGSAGSVVESRLDEGALAGRFARGRRYLPWEGPPE